MPTTRTEPNAVELLARDLDIVEKEPDDFRAAARLSGPRHGQVSAVRLLRGWLSTTADLAAKAGSAADREKLDAEASEASDAVAKIDDEIRDLERKLADAHLEREEQAARAAEARATRDEANAAVDELREATTKALRRRLVDRWKATASRVSNLKSFLDYAAGLEFRQAPDPRVYPLRSALGSEADQFIRRDDRGSEILADLESAKRLCELRLAEASEELELLERQEKVAIPDCPAEFWCVRHGVS